MLISVNVIFNLNNINWNCYIDVSQNSEKIVDLNNKSCSCAKILSLKHWKRNHI